MLVFFSSIERYLEKDALKIRTSSRAKGINEHIEKKFHSHTFLDIF